MSYQGSIPPTPPGNYGQPAFGGQPPPPNYLVFGILTTIFCCLPFGVVSIVYAAQVNDKWNSGDAIGAIESSNKARKWATWSAVSGLIVTVLTIIFFLILGFAASQSGTSTSP